MEITKSAIRGDFDLKSRLKKIKTFLKAFSILTVALGVILFAHAFILTCAMNY